MDSLAEEERRLRNHLTTIRLANQILDRRTGLSREQRRLVRTALDACDELTLQLLARRQARMASPDDRWRSDPMAFAAAPDRPTPPDDAFDPSSSGHPVDAIVVAPDGQARNQLAELLVLQGYAVQRIGRVDPAVERLLAERRRLIVLSPDPDVGQAEIEAQVRRLRAVAPRSAILVCLEGEQAPRAVESEQMAILRRPFGGRALLLRAAELYPAGPPRRAWVAERRA